MSKSHWTLVALVAAMVCNGSCRPRKVDVKNIYPVYRSEKQLELETPNRYEKPYKGKSDDDSISYHRIDIPYKTVNGMNAVGELAIKNNSKSIIDYVPVALTIKKSNIKVWPSDQNGIESSDDLTLYNVYTNNINPLNIHHLTTSGYDPQYHYTTHSKPSILILEELTTRRPFYNYDSVYTQPIQVLERPPSPPPSHVFYPPPHHSLTHRPPYATSEEPPSAEPEPTEQAVTARPIATAAPPPTETPTPVSPQTSRPETTTKKRKNTRCPNVSITATSVINNSNSIQKEGCQDINIHINTDVSNSNSGHVAPDKPNHSVIVVTSRPSNNNPGVVISNYPSSSNPGVSVSNNPVNTSVVVVQNEATAPTGLGFGIFDLVWSIFSRIFNFSFFNHISGGVSSPLSTLFTGLSAFFLPWIFPHLLLYGLRSRKLGPLAMGESDPVHFAGSIEGVDFQSTARDEGPGPRKKISRYKRGWERGGSGAWEEDASIRQQSMWGKPEVGARDPSKRKE